MYRLIDCTGNVVGTGETPEEAVENYWCRYDDIDVGSGDQFQIRFDGDDDRLIPVEF